MSKKKKKISSKSSQAQKGPIEKTQGTPKRYPVFEPEFREDFKFLARINPSAYDKVWKFIDECLVHPFNGIGKPEPLKYLGSDIWSRRVTLEDRFVYRVGQAKIDFLTCRHHYE
ncbi:MAG: Txe/YoeB family addiction module toxin [Cyanobacteria bacterium J06598_1]